VSRLIWIHRNGALNCPTTHDPSRARADRHQEFRGGNFWTPHHTGSSEVVLLCFGWFGRSYLVEASFSGTYVICNFGIPAGRYQSKTQNDSFLTEPRSPAGRLSTASSSHPAPNQPRSKPGYLEFVEPVVRILWPIMRTSTWPSNPFTAGPERRETLSAGRPAPRRQEQVISAQPQRLIVGWWEGKRIDRRPGIGIRPTEVAQFCDGS
jgi:hypothetical protein